MSRIGEMPDVDEIQNNGFLIYSDDGLYAKKITVEDFATAMGILMSNDSEVGGETGSGLVGWKEYVDAHLNHYLITDYMPEYKGPWGLADKFRRDSWSSHYQFDAWDSPYDIPNLSNVSVKLENLNPEESPYVLFAMPHRIGDSLDDYTKVSTGVYKIKTEDIGALKCRIYFLVDGDVDSESVIYDLTELNSFNISWHIGYGFGATLYRYELDDIYSNEDDLVSALSETFPILAGQGVAIAGYENVGRPIDNIAKYYSKDSYPDENVYTYINFDISGVQGEVQYNDNGENVYTSMIENPEVDGSYADWPGGGEETDVYKNHIAKLIGSMLQDIISLELRPLHTALASSGLYIGYPFSRDEMSLQDPLVAIDYAQAKIDVTGIHFGQLAGYANECIYVPEAYSSYLIDYINNNSSYVEKVNDILIASVSAKDDNGVIRINLGPGLYFDGDTNSILIDENDLQLPLTAGHGVSINSQTNTITFNSDVTDVAVDGVSVVDSEGVADIELPTGLRQIRLLNGNYTQVTTVDEDTDYIEQKIDIYGLSNHFTVVDNGQNNIELDEVHTDTLLGNIYIPPNVTGLLTYEILLYTNDTVDYGNDRISSVLTTNIIYPVSDENAYIDPSFDTELINESVDIDSMHLPGITKLNCCFPVTDSSSGRYFHLIVRKLANCSMYGNYKITFIENIDI